MRAVLSGKAPRPEYFDEYHRAFHDERRSVTERVLEGFVDERGRTSYGRLVDAVDVSRGRVLDIGCGDGVLLEQLIARHRAIRVSGIDLSPGEIARAQRRLPAANVDDLVVAAAESMPFTNDAFDAVASHLVVMLIRDVNAALQQVRRVLRQRGVFAFVVPRPPLPSEITMQLLQSIRGWVREIYPDYAPVNPGDPRIFATQTLESMLHDCGFSDVRIDDFTVQRAVGIDILRRRMGLLYYVGTLPEDARMRVYERLTEWAGDRTILYRESMRIIVAR